MSKDRDGRVTQAQMHKLLDLLSRKGVLQDGKVVYKETSRLKFWRRIAVHLNNVNDGSVKNFHKWCKVWADWKNKTKRKADILVQGKYGNQKPNITELELKLLQLINYPLDGVISVLNEDKTNQTHEETEQLNDHDPIHNILDENSIGIDSDDNREFISVGVEDTWESKHSYTFDSEKIIIGGVDVKEEELLSKKDNIYEGSTDKDACNTEMLEHYKIKIRLALEKERLHQRSEELKLKALEPKLKADELKLHETEVSRVNYLTQLEEQKLKAITNIATLLKELVDWTRNASARFPNVI